MSCQSEVHLKHQHSCVHAQECICGKNNLDNKWSFTLQLGLFYTHIYPQPSLKPLSDLK